MKNIVSAFMVTVLLVSILVLGSDARPVEANEPIYIRADGSIDPPTAPLVTLDNIIYALTDNVASNASGILVERDNIILDGAGYTLQGPRTFLSKGIGLSDRTNVTVRNTHIRDFYAGVGASSSTSNTVSGNHLTANAYGVLFGSSSTSNAISGNRVIANGVGVLLDSSSTNTVSGNNVTASGDYGVRLFGSANNTISGNNITNNYGGVYLVSSANNTVSGNSITVNDWHGVWLDSSSTNTVSGNNITNNYGGVYLYSSSTNTVSGNNVANNEHGVTTASSFSNTVSSNNITANGYGVFLGFSYSNRFYHNYVIDNTLQVSIVASGYPNSWDDGYPSGGNYWSNYTGVDLNHDGIGDTPHVLGESNTDYYPLMGMFSSFNITSEHYIQTICNSTISDFQHNGTAISFDVTGENGTSGFCRICIPKALMNETYRVFVNGTEIPPSPELLPFSNSTHSYLYFTYNLSTKEVVIIPEFPSLIILSLFMITCLAVSLLWKRLHKSVTHPHL